MNKNENFYVWLSCAAEFGLAIIVLAAYPNQILFTLALTALVLLFLVLFFQILYLIKRHSLQKRGLLFSAEKATSQDAEKLLRAGERLRAITLYRSLYRVSLPDAVQAIDKIQATF